jgi:hypothetical protein
VAVGEGRKGVMTMALTPEQWSQKYMELTKLLEETISRSFLNPNWAIEKVKELQAKEVEVQAFKEKNQCNDLSYTKGPDGRFYLIGAKFIPEEGE